MLSAFCIKYLKAEKIYFNSKFFIFSPAKFIINFCLFSILGMKFLDLQASALLGNDF